MMFKRVGRRGSLVGASIAVAGLILSAGEAAIARGSEGIELLGVARLPGDTIDRSGLKGDLHGVPANRLGGLSALDYTGSGDRYIALSDRGPGDGATAFPCRWHTIELKAPRGADQPASARLVATTLLRTAEGQPYIGLASAFSAGGRSGRRLDPEGIRCGSAGTVFVSDEYGPDVIEFASDGKALRNLAVPRRYSVKHPAASREEELANNTTGRTPNGGFEGLAIAAEGTRVYALAQVPLLQDAHVSKSGKRKGTICRLLEIDSRTGTMREFAYPLDRPQNKLSEILAAGDGSFLVLERDGLGGTAAEFKKIVKIRLDDASNTSGIEAFTGGKLPAEIRPIRKSVFLDLLDPRFAIAGKNCPEKFEGLSWGPALADARRVLWVCVDNDFKPGAPSLFYAFAVPR